MIALNILYLLLLLQPPIPAKDGQHTSSYWTRPASSSSSPLLLVSAERCNYEKYTTGCFAQSNFECDLDSQQCVCTPDYPILIDGRWCLKRARYNQKCQYNQQCDNKNGLYCLYSDNETPVENKRPIASLKNPFDYHAKCRCKSKEFRHHVRKHNSIVSNETAVHLVKPHHPRQKNHHNHQPRGAHFDDVFEEVESCIEPVAVDQKCDHDVQCSHATKNSICDETARTCRCNDQYYYDSNKDTCEQQPQCGHTDTSDRISQCYKFNASTRRCEKVGFFCSLPRFLWIFLIICMVALLIFLLTIRSQYNPSLFMDDRLSITSNSGGAGTRNDNYHGQRRNRRTVNCQQSHLDDASTGSGRGNGANNASRSSVVAIDPSSCEYDVPPPYDVAINMKI